MIDYVLGFVFTAALFGLRAKRTKDGWSDLWALHAAIGSPGLPCTASWYQACKC